MNKIIFLLMVSACSVHDFRRGIVNDMYINPKIKFFPLPESKIEDDVIPLAVQIHHSMGIKYVDIFYLDQKKSYSYNDQKYPTKVTLDERLSVSNSGPITVGIRAVSGKNTELITNIEYSIQIMSTYVTFSHPNEVSRDTSWVKVSFLSATVPALRVLIMGPTGTVKKIAPPGGFPSVEILIVTLNKGVNHFTLIVESVHKRITRYEFKITRI